MPGGSVIEADGTVTEADDGGPVRLHTEQALGRLIEWWQKPALRALVRTYTDEIQEAESMLWDVIVSRFVDYAAGVHLDRLGRVVGEPRKGKGDAAYRARIKARIRINQSFGNPVDVIGVLRAVDPAAFHFVEMAPASFVIVYDEPAVSLAVQGEIPGIVAECRAAGVGAGVIQPIDDPGVLDGAFNFCDVDLAPLGTGLGLGDVPGLFGAGDYGGTLSWYASA